MEIVFPGLFEDMLVGRVRKECDDGPCGCWALYAIDACSAQGSYADIYTTTLA